MEVRTFITYLLFVILLSSCAQITPFHTARTEGAGNLTFTPTLDATVVAASVSNAFGTQAFPGLRAELAYGLIEKVDLIASLNSSGSFKGSLKYQLYGDNFSNFAFAIMPGYEYQSNLFNQGISTSIQRIHMPLLFSIKGNEFTDYYAGPNAVIQIEDRSENTLLSGINIGMEIGRRIRYNIGLGAYLPYSFNGNVSGSLYQFGISARIPLNGRD